MPISLSARITRTAISPRFATSTLENIGAGLYRRPPRPLRRSEADQTQPGPADGRAPVLEAHSLGEGASHFSPGRWSCIRASARPGARPLADRHHRLGFLPSNRSFVIGRPLAVLPNALDLALDLGPLLGLLALLALLGLLGALALRLLLRCGSCWTSRQVPATSRSGEPRSSSSRAGWLPLPLPLPSWPFPLPSSFLDSPADWSWSLPCSVLFLLLEFDFVDASLLWLTFPLKQRRADDRDARRDVVVALRRRRRGAGALAGAVVVRALTGSGSRCPRSPRPRCRHRRRTGTGRCPAPSRCRSRPQPRCRPRSTARRRR